MTATIGKTELERIQRVETLVEGQAEDIRELLTQVREIASALRSITNDAAADSRRLGDVAKKVDDLTTTVEGIVRRESERGLLLRAGATISGMLVTVGGAGMWAWGHRHVAAEFLKRIWG